MINVYYCGTPNGLKIKLSLEEAGLAYRIIPVDIGKGELFGPTAARCRMKSARSCSVGPRRRTAPEG